MKNIIFHLSTCDTNKRILNEVKPSEDVLLQDIKVDNIDAESLDYAAEKLGSYEQLFSKRARKYRAMGLHEKEITDQEYRQFILDEYTFLKRPVAIIEGEVFAGNSKKNVEALKESLLGKQ